MSQFWSALISLVFRLSVQFWTNRLVTPTWARLLVCPGPLWRARFSISENYAAFLCKSPMETSLTSPIEMSRSSVCERPIEVAWNDGDHDEPQRADAPAGADRYWRWTAFGRGRYRADRRWPKTDLPIARGVSSSRRGRSDFAQAWPDQQPCSWSGIPRDRAGYRG